MTAQIQLLNNNVHPVGANLTGPRLAAPNTAVDPTTNSVTSGVSRDFNPRANVSARTVTEYGRFVLK